MYSPTSIIFPSGVALREYDTPGWINFIFPSPACNKCIILTRPGQYNVFFRILSELVFGLRYTTTKTCRLTDLQILNIIWQIVHGTSSQIPLNIMISWRVLYIGQNNYHFRPLGAHVERTLSFTLYLLQMRKNEFVACIILNILHICW